jgi:hypothetical protein
MMPHVMGVLGRHVAVGDGSIVPGPPPKRRTRPAI